MVVPTTVPSRYNVTVVAEMVMTAVCHVPSTLLDEHKTLDVMPAIAQRYPLGSIHIQCPAALADVVADANSWFEPPIKTPEPLLTLKEIPSESVV